MPRQHRVQGHDTIEKHNIFALEAVAAYIDPTRKELRAVHAVGDGTFIVDRRRMDRKWMMASKLPSAVCRLPSGVP